MQLRGLGLATSELQYGILFIMAIVENIQKMYKVWMLISRIN